MCVPTYNYVGACLLCASPYRLRLWSSFFSMGACKDVRKKCILDSKHLEESQSGFLSIQN